MLDFFQGEQLFWVRVKQHVGTIIPFSSWLVFIVGKSSGVFRVITCYHYPKYVNAWVLPTAQSLETHGNPRHGAIPAASAMG